jgi:N-acetylneuraminate synthase
MFKINNDGIGEGFKPYMIAELSANHGGSIDRAKKSIKAAKQSGASAVKLQTYTPDTMTLNSQKDDFLVTEGLWKGYNLYNLYEEAYTPYEWHSELFSYAKSIGITIFSTPFDETAVDLLEELNTPAYKIASFEITDLALIEYTAKKQKPMLMSTGMSSIEEISLALECCKQQGNHEILLFDCISCYPADLADSNLGNLKYLKNYFNVEVGLSDHTTSNLASVLAVSLGAKVIEKHFKFDNDDCGPDASFSILPDQLKSLVNECTLASEALDAKEFKRSGSEMANKRFRRSLYFCNDLPKGHIVTANDVRRVRPALGLELKYYDKVIGRRLSHSVELADRVRWDSLNSSE